jgi:3-dehydroquinate dehydratase-2
LLNIAKGHQLECFQSNAENEIIDKIQNARDDGVQVIIINPAALTHTSIAMRDAFLAVKIPFYEVHLSNIHARETFRHISYFSDIAIGVVSGFGPQGYYAALQAAIEKFS